MFGEAESGARRGSYLSGASDAPLIGATIGDYFDQIVEPHGEREALVVRHQGLRFSYRELRAAAERCARGLLALGIRRGERVGIWATNRAEWTIAQFGTAKIGAILVNINPAYRTAELEYALRHSGVRSLIFPPQLRHGDALGMVRSLLPALEALPARPDALQAETLPDLKHLILLDEEACSGTWTWNDLLGRAEEVPAQELAARQAALQFDDPINIQYTSGTTGLPKGATLSHHNILNNAFFAGERMRFSEQDRLCIPVPLYHCFGMVLGNLLCATHGAAMVYPAEVFDPRATLAAVEAERCTALHGVPTMFIALLDHPEFDGFDLASLRTGIMAGAPCPIELMKQVIARLGMAEVEIGYGMTETSPLSFQSTATDPVEKRVSTVGQIMPHVEAKIVDPGSGAVVPEGTPGEFCSRGYPVMLGYWNDPEATARAIDAARWMHSGYLAVMEEGYVKIVGRIKDMIVRGGENISPREIEELLHTHPVVAEAQVIGVPNRRYGEEVMAWVRLKPGAGADPEELRAYCRDRISRFKVPRYVKLVDRFPMTVTGKVQKYVMREQAVRELGLEGEREGV
jgi:fatty-acyl-CoA synthase